MEYKHISVFFDKFKKALFKNEEYYEVITQVVGRHISSPINPKLVKIKGTTIYIQGTPMLRNEILIHKNGILSDLNSLLSDKNFTDIR